MWKEKKIPLLFCEFFSYILLVIFRRYYYSKSMCYVPMDFVETRMGR